MTKAQLLNALADIPDDADIFITYKDDEDLHPINYIKQTYSKGAYLQTDEIPTIENLQNLAEALLRQGGLAKCDVHLLEDFIC